jgi:hypothetical protein
LKFIKSLANNKMHSINCFVNKCNCPNLQATISELSESITALHSIAIHQQAAIDALEMRLEAQQRLFMTATWGRNVADYRGLMGRNASEQAPPLYKDSEEEEED